MIRRPPRPTRTDTLFPTRRSSDLARRRRPAVDIEHVRIFALGMEPRREDAAVVRDLFGRQDDRTRTVAEQHAGRAVLPVETAAERLAADHQRVLSRARPQHRLADPPRLADARPPPGDAPPHADSHPPPPDDE